MFKIAVAIIVGLVVIICIAFAWMAAMSRSGRAPGLVDGRLQACGSAPNCVYSDAGAGAVAPFEVDRQHMEEAWARLREAVVAAGGTVTEFGDEYLAAEFRSSLFGFVDDFEARLDAAGGTIEVRSASRVGHSDFGVNAARVAALREALQKAPS